MSPKAKGKQSDSVAAISLEQSLEKNYVGSKGPAGFPGLPASWHTEPLTISTGKGSPKLFAALHRKTREPVQTLLIVVHGFGEHGGRYLHFPHYLEEKFDAVFVPDQRGHGRSEGQRGHVEKFDLLVDDQVRMLSEIKLKLREKSGTSPTEIHILGHSLGGHVVLRLAHLHPDLGLKAIHISSPFLALKAAVNPMKRSMAHAISKIWGTLSLRAEFDASVLSQDTNVVQHYTADRLNHDRMTPRMYVSMTEAMRDTLENFRNCNYPIQFLLPTEDPLVDSAVSSKFFEKLKSTEKRMVDLPGFRHEPMNELEKEKFFKALLDFPIFSSKI